MDSDWGLDMDFKMFVMCHRLTLHFYLSWILTFSKTCCVCVCVSVLLSHVQLFVTPWAVSHQALPSMKFSRQEYWSPLPFPDEDYLGKGLF